MISVIVPIYNVSEYLNECIESIINQSYSDLDIILVNDGSTDSSLSICKKYAQKDGRITVVDKPNGGLLSARKAGVELAKGDYISFVDGDDFVEKNLYERLYDIINCYDVDVISYGLKTFSDNKFLELKDMCPSGFYSRDEMESNVFPIMMINHRLGKNGINAGIVLKLVRRQLISSVINTINLNIGLAEDASLSYPCIYLAKSMYCDSDNTSYIYRILSNSMSHKYNEKWYDNCQNYLEWMEKFFKNTANVDIRNGINNEIFCVFLRGIKDEITNCIYDKKASIKKIYSYPLEKYLKTIKNSQYPLGVYENRIIKLIRFRMIGLYIRIKRVLI